MSGFEESVCVEKGVLTGLDESETPYSIMHGCNYCYSLECNKTWSAFNLELMETVCKLEISDEKRSEILISFQLEDYGWDWFTKSISLQGSEYEWFYLYAEGLPQGVCLIFHPKKSELSSGEIFYVEYFASAPWNRNSAIHNRKFKGVGTSLLLRALKYSTETLNLRMGFSLHSLPQATGFYEKSLKMKRSDAHNKGQLIYFELLEQEAQGLLNV